MRHTPAGLALVAGVGGFLADPSLQLHVLRAGPTGDASPAASVTVSFDRPVAGSLDRSVDPATVLTIEPAIPGTFEWRDPITLRFRPARPLEPARTHTVTVGTGFTAMDGTRLAQPYRFSFRVSGPAILAGSPVNADEHPIHLTAAPAFHLVLSAPVDPARVARAVYLEFGATCPQPGTVPLRLDSQRAITPDDPWQFREAGGWERDRDADSLRRVVRLVPERPLPLGCAGELVHPGTIDATVSTALQRWPFATYGPFRLAAAGCRGGGSCPTGPITLQFSTPVKGADLLRRLAILPAVPFTVPDTAETRDQWTVEAQLTPRTPYAVRLDPTLADAFGQRLGGNPVATVTTTGYEPAVNYAYGRTTVERAGLRTLMVSFVNVDTLDVRITPIPRRLEPRILARTWGGLDDILAEVKTGTIRTRIPVRYERDRVGIYGVRLPAGDATTPGAPSLFAVQVSAPNLPRPEGEETVRRPIALVQVTDLGVHAKVGVEEARVWVTGASDGQPRAGTTVAVRDAAGRLLARGVTDAQGLATLTGFPPPPPRQASDESGGWGFQGYVEATRGADRAVVGVTDGDPDLAPWRFNVSGAWGMERVPAAAAVFTERGIYRPGETVLAKAIVRTGPLGALRLPARTDSLRWRALGRDGEVLREQVVAPGPFGSSTLSLPVAADAGLGTYTVAIELRREGRWQPLHEASYRVAEYRPPEFLVDVTADTATRFALDSASAIVQARYLFGAPMARAAVRWVARQQTVQAWELQVPGTDGWYLGENGWWEEEGERSAVLSGGEDTLDAGGQLRVPYQLGPAPAGRAVRATFQAVVADVNNQAVGAQATRLVHPAAFYLAARPGGTEYFWQAGRPQSVALVAVRPDGGRVAGVRVGGAVVRREWHQVRRERDGYAELVGEWVSDTVARCPLVTAAEQVSCRFTPAAGGTYVVAFTARDAAGREVRTSFMRWATGPGWVPWSDESQFRMDVIPDRARYDVGDTATVLFASPFTEAEAWVTVEREGLIEQRRLRIRDGATTLRIPVTEAHAPNAFVAIVVARGRSAAPGPLDDPGRPTLRVGYAQIRVTPGRKRLAVAVRPDRAEYRPGDTARVALQVSDVRRAGQRSEVTVWAVDEGVLSLTGYRTPDPLDLLYQPRGLGLRLGSTLVSVAPQVPEGIKGRRAPGGGGGEDAADILRSRFQATAFFLGSVVTDSAGRATATVRLPDNLTTFRVMAVAVTAGDRFGSGQAPLLVTRPLVVRPALPRFLREGDQLGAGLVVNQRAGGTPEVVVSIAVRGATVAGDATRTVRLEAGRGRSVRFPVSATGPDTAVFRLGASGAGDADRVEARIPFRPAGAPRTWTVAGVLYDTATVRFALPAGIDPERSRLTLGLGSSPLAVLAGTARALASYPYACSEQVASAVLPLAALLRAQRTLGGDSLVPAGTRRDLERQVATLQQRAREDGGIGLWRAGGWTTPWLSAYAGMALLEARAAGVAVKDTVLRGLVSYLTAASRAERVAASPVGYWYRGDRERHGDRVMAADFLRRAGRPDPALEHELVRVAGQLRWEDRARLAGLVARAGDPATARRLLQAVWASVRVEGRRAVLPDSTGSDFYFASFIRPAATLLAATLAVDPAHPLVAPLVETVLTARGGELAWNTQDAGSAVMALAQYERLRRAGAARPVRVEARGRPVLATGGRQARDTSVALTGLLDRPRDGAAPLVLRLAAGGAAPAPAFFHLTVTEVARERPVTPDERGIRVERWYERASDGTPVTSVAEGEVVRVRLRVTAPAERRFVVLDDPLPAGLEAIDLSLRTAAAAAGPGRDFRGELPGDGGEPVSLDWQYGAWDAGWWTPFDHRELRDDRVVYVATRLWRGSYSVSYLARATNPGTFIRPPARAEEMYNPAVSGRSDGGTFTVTEKPR